jgi:hypothetical protein
MGNLNSTLGEGKSRIRENASEKFTALELRAAIIIGALDKIT